jgi:hypothetical protein
MVSFGLKNMAMQDWRDRFEHTGANGGPINLEALLLRGEELEQIKTIDHDRAVDRPGGDRRPTIRRLPKDPLDLSSAESGKVAIPMPDAPVDTHAQRAAKSSPG